MTNLDSSNLVITVDDSKTMRDMVSFTVKELGFDVIAAGDGKEALMILQTQKVALIISDLNMPHMDGLSLLQQIRHGSSVNKKTPVLMVTTEGDKEKVLKAKELGATGWIIKPFSPEKLKAVVQKVCGSSPATAAAQ